MTYEEPKGRWYKRKRRRPTPDEEKILQRWRAEADRKLRERLRQRYGH